jgi:hypothetical protein
MFLFLNSYIHITRLARALQPVFCPNSYYFVQLIECVFQCLLLGMLILLALSAFGTLGLVHNPL